MKKTDANKKLTLKEFTEKYLPSEMATRKTPTFSRQKDYAQLGKDIIDEVRRDLKI